MSSITQKPAKLHRERSIIERQSTIGGSSEADRAAMRSRHRMSAASSSRIKVSASAAFRARGSRAPASAASKQQQSQHHQVAATILQRRDRLRVYESGEDVTPRNLVHPLYSSLEDRRTAFDAIGLAQLLGSSHGGSVSQIPMQQPRQSLATVSSFSSSIYTVDEIESLTGSARPSLKGSTKDGAEEDDDAPSQFHLPRLDSRQHYGPNDKVTITLRETETFFLFDLPQLTEDARTEAGQAVIEENERYRSIMAGAGRKTVDAETQTPQLYTKTRGTYIGRQERKNRATFVNNWVMHDSYQDEEKIGAGEPHEKDRFKFPQAKQSELQLQPEDQLAAIAATDAYEDATRVTLRILASKRYEEAQKRFAGLLRQDPCDPALELVYGLEPLWTHENEKTRHRAVSAFKWNPANGSLLAVGYGAAAKSSSSEEPSPPDGLVLLWCAKNPSEPDRCYEFSSPVSDLDWSKSRPNLLAVGFYDGIVRIVDVSKKQLAVVRQSQRKSSPSYEPHWQVQWWPIFDDQLDPREQLYSSNQDGRVSFYPAQEAFASRQILKLQRIHGRIPGIRRVNHCLGHDVPISRSPGALLLRRHPDQPGIYLVGTEEGCVLRCSTAQPQQHLDSFLAHDGPIYSLEFSPFCGKLMLSCGADWTTRIWAEGLDEPLLCFGTRMASVNAAAWSPKNSTIFASAVGNEICIWDIRRKTHRPASVTRVCEGNARLQRLEFTRSGEQIVAADDEGVVYVMGLTGMPLPPFDQTQTLVEALRKALLTKPEILRRLAKIGQPFDAVV